MGRSKTLTDEDRAEKRRQKNRTYNAKTNEIIYSKYEGKCVFCGKPVPQNEMKLSLIVSANEGGRYVRDNMELSCVECYHREKSKRAKVLAKKRKKRDKSTYNYTKSLQLCWRCKKACGGYDCEWANKLKPVEGWVAVPTVKTANGNCPMHSYHITECPKFER